jgi:hypothetical protein
MKLITAISRCVYGALLDLLVTVSGMLEADHYLALGTVLWRQCLLDSRGPASTAVSKLLFFNSQSD